MEMDIAGRKWSLSHRPTAPERLGEDDDSKARVIRVERKL